MADTQIKIAALVSWVAGMLSGDYTIIILSALIGSLWPLSNSQTATRKEGVFLVLRLVGTASILTSLIAWVIQQRFGIPASKALGPVALIITSFGDQWKDIILAVRSRLVSIILGNRNQ